MPLHPLFRRMRLPLQGPRERYIQGINVRDPPQRCIWTQPGASKTFNRMLINSILTGNLLQIARLLSTPFPGRPLSIVSQSFIVHAARLLDSLGTFPERGRSKKFVHNAQQKR